MFTETPSPVLKDVISLLTMEDPKHTCCCYCHWWHLISNRRPLSQCCPALAVSLSWRKSLQRKAVCWRTGQSTREMSCGAPVGLHGCIPRAGTAIPSAFHNSTLAALLRTCLTILPHASLSKIRLKSEESSDLMGSLLSLQLDLGPSFLDERLNVLDKNKY